MTVTTIKPLLRLRFDGLFILLLAWCARAHCKQENKRPSNKRSSAGHQMIVTIVSVAKNNNASLQNDKLMHTASESYFTVGISKRAIVECLVDRFTSKECTDKVSRYRLKAQQKKAQVLDTRSCI